VLVDTSPKMGLVGMVIATSVFCVLFCVGTPFCLLLPACFEDRLSAAPVFGLACLGMFATIGYFFGLPTAVLIVGVGLAVIVSVVLISLHYPSPHYFVLLPFGVLLCLACYLPFWLNGYETNFFHTNPTDQINYISIAAGMRSRTAAELASVTLGEPSLPVFAAHINLFSRPTAPLILSIAARAFQMTSAETMMRFVPLLQAISAFGVLFFLRNALQMTRTASLIVAAAYALGFFPTYIVDINALSSLSALSFPPVLIAILYGQKIAPNSSRLFVAAGIIAAAIVVFYPESVPAVAPAATVLAACLILQTKERLLLVLYFALAATVPLLLVAPIWRGTLRFLFSQLETARIIHDSWISVFDAFYTPYSGIPGYSVTLVGSAIDLVAGALGLFLLAPSPNLPPVAFFSWRLCEGALLVGLLAAPIYLAVKRNKLDLVLSCFSPIVLPIALFISGDMWAAGKAVTMISPLMFCVAASPLLQPRAVTATPAAFLVLLNLIMGADRLVSQAKSDAFKETAGYPKPAALLNEANWNVPFWKNSITQCRMATMNVSNPFLARVIETMLLETNIPYRSINERRVYYSEDVHIPPEPPDQNADCFISDSGVAR
jgi:hypothetical protein